MKIVAVAASSVLLATAIHATVFGAGPARCESLTSLAQPDTVGTAAELVPAGRFTPPGTAMSIGSMILPAFCRVAATLKPTSDSRIRIEVWMPASGWNGKFQAVGNGGWNGTIEYPGLAEALRRGYAAGSTDTGHVGNSASFAVGHPEKLIDFGYRAVHEMTLHAKGIVSAFYGRAPALAYWVGCSSGGKQGLKEAQRFPADYDGIIVGAPANAWTHLAASSVWIAQATLGSPASYVPATKFELLHKAVVDACDALDGLKDGVIADPTRCHFDPQLLQCREGEDGPGCLTAAQVDAVRKIYSGPRHPRTGAPIFPGLEPGSELGWAELAGGPKLGTSADDHFRYVVFRNPRWDFKTFAFETDVAMTDAVDDGLINATDPHLEAFVGRGGKLLLYHGWSDPLIAPRSTVEYYTAVTSALGGAEETSKAVRLFMAPGVGHCTGGEGPSQFDMLTALEQWVEHGTAPERIVASHVRDGVVDRTRPLCAYPTIARYSGTGGTTDAASFVCVRP
jgi:feruloyl esterase